MKVRTREIDISVTDPELDVNTGSCLYVCFNNKKPTPKMVKKNCEIVSGNINTVSPFPFFVC